MRERVFFRQFSLGVVVFRDILCGMKGGGDYWAGMSVIWRGGSTMYVERRQKTGEIFGKPVGRGVGEVAFKYQARLHAMHGSQQVEGDKVQAGEAARGAPAGETGWFLR
jgi:hypothetical protein